MEDKHYALAREAILAALTAYTGVTTADGATPVFNTLIDANLIGKNDFISGKTVLIGSGDALYEDRGAALFDNTDGTITVESPFSARIKKGTVFRILNAAAGQMAELLDALVSYRGTTTADGAVGGGTLVCSDLTTKPDFDGNQVVIKSGPYAGQVRDIDGVTTGGTVTPHTSFGGTITEGTRFSITAIRTVPAEVAALAADVGDASSSTLGSLYGILGDPEVALGHSIGHVPKYVGGLLYVDGVNGDDANSGQEPHVAKKTIGAAVTAASAGDRIIVKAATYDEAIDLNKNGLELICEQGAILSNATPGTVLIVSADYCLVVGPILAQAGQTGLQVTGNFNSIEDCLAFGCSVGFDIGGAENHTDNCRSIQHTTTGFDITGSYGIHRR
ncbi:MAG: hypothetical protein JRE40_10435, partial [Deltaproteobacteria bacterium]|nr:hypothetical protein [Deltaproteobacteria bacterium]